MLCHTLSVCVIQDKNLQNSTLKMRMELIILKNYCQAGSINSLLANEKGDEHCKIFARIYHH